MSEAFRITPLPQHYKKMKREYYDHFQKRKFKQYQSPWIPVSDANIQHLNKGDLVITDRGIEYPYLVGRQIQQIKNGEITKTFFFTEKNYKRPLFVWVDPRQVDIRDYSIGYQYKEYSENVQELLRTAYSNKVKIVQLVQFPLYHETNLGYAQNLLINGFDIFSHCCPVKTQNLAESYS